MAVLFGVNIYQINSQTPIPLASVSKLFLPGAAVLVRPVNGAFGILLNTGVQVYSQIQLIDSGTSYLAVETPTAVAALANA